MTDDSNNSHKCPNNCTSRNGSIIKMTMQNNHLIVETEERNVSFEIRASNQV